MFGIEDNQGNIVTDHQQALRIWEKYIQDLYMQRRKATGDNIPVDLLMEMGDSGLKIMIALVNKIYMSGEWPKETGKTIILYQVNTEEALRKN